MIRSCRTNEQLKAQIVVVLVTKTAHQVLKQKPACSGADWWSTNWRVRIDGLYGGTELCSGSISRNRNLVMLGSKVLYLLSCWWTDPSGLNHWPMYMLTGRTPKASISRCLHVAARSAFVSNARRLRSSHPLKAEASFCPPLYSAIIVSANLMTLITNIYIASSGVNCTSSRQHLHGCRSRNLANFIWNEMVIKIAYPVWIIRPEIKKNSFFT
jgi:hypothetical protein